MECTDDVSLLPFWLEVIVLRFQVGISTASLNADIAMINPLAAVTPASAAAGSALLPQASADGDFGRSFGGEAGIPGGETGPPGFISASQASAQVSGAPPPHGQPRPESGATAPVLVVPHAGAGVLVSSAVAALRYDQALWQALVTALGGGFNTAVTTDIFECKEDDLIWTVDNMRINETLLLPLEKGRLLRQLRDLAEAMGYERPGLGGLRRRPETSSPSASTQAPVGPSLQGPQAAAPVISVNNKRKFSTCLAAGDETEFMVLPKEKVRRLNADFRELWGSEAREYEDHTWEQLSAVAAKVAMDEAPYTDFSVFGPYGKRLQRLMSCRAQIFIDNELVTKTIQGPSSFEQWRRCFKVFRGIALKLRFSKQGPLEDYEEGFRQLAQSFPKHWGHLVVVGDQMRSERWGVIRERLENLWALGQYPTGLSPERPWEAVLSYTAYSFGQDRDWWFARVDKPCLQAPTAGGAAAQAAVVEGDIVVAEFEHRQGLQRSSGNSGQRSSVNNSGAGGSSGGNTGRGSRNQRKFENWCERKEVAAEEGRRADGRYIKDNDGRELCFNWNRSMTGCSAGACTANPKRGHLCEWCLEPHRAVDDSACKASKRPVNWRPQMKGGGKKGR